MTAADRCLDAEQVRALLGDQLALEEMGPALEHLEQCSHCADLLQRHAGHSAHPSRASAIDTLIEGPESSIIDGLIERLGDQAGRQAPPAHDSWATVAGVGNGEDSFPFLAPPEAPDEMGRLGRYRVLRLLGSGGMGVVFLAEDSGLHRLVALKVIRPELSGSRDYRERFLREARSAATIEHDHIVTVYHAGEEGGVPMLAMQLLEGETLEDRLKREGKLPPAEAARIGREIAEALHAAHGRGLVHRDIKPANVWLEGERRRVKVLDFGLARPLEGGGELTQAGAVIGTPAYMAPEQAEGGAIDLRADLFSLGAVLYRMVTGEPPFRGENPLAILRSLANDVPPPPHEVAPEVPVLLGKLIQRLLSKQAADRPASANQVAAELVDIEAGPAQPQRQPVPPRRRRWLLPAMAAACLLLAGTIAVAWLILAGTMAAPVVLKLKTRDGELVLTVPEEGLKVFIDGKERTDAGPAKSWRVALPPGEHHLQIKKGEATRYEVKFTVEAGEPAYVEATLTSRPEAYAAGASPLDKLRHDDIPEAECFAGQPKELVKIVGTQAWHSWGADEYGIPRESLASLVFDTDGKTVLVCTSIRNTIRVADAATGKERALIRASREIDPSLMYRVPSYSSDGRFVALPSGHSGDWTWQILDVLTGKKIRTSLRGGAPALVRVHLTRDGKRLVAVMSDNATWNVYDESGDMPSAVVTHGTPSFLSRLELSPDGQFLAWMAPKEKDGKTPEVHVWDINAKKEKWKFDGPDLHSFPEIAFSPDGRYLAIPGNPLLVWDLVQGKVHPTPEQDGKKVAPVRCVFSADSKLMVCDDTLWDVTTAKQHCVLEGPRAPYYHLNFLFSPDGKTLAAIGVDNAIRTWDTTTGKLKNAVQPLLHLMAVSADGGKIAVMDRSVANRLMIKDMIDSKNDLVLTLPKGQGFYAVQFGEEGRKLAAIFTTGQGCRVYDLTKKDDDAFASYGHLGASNIAFAQDGKTLVTGDHGSGGIKIWDVATKKERRIVAPPKKPHYVRIALTADGKTLAYTTDAGVRVEETATGKTITTLKAELPYENSGRLCFSQDGKRLAYYSYPGGQVWDLATGKTLPYAALFDRGFAFGPDGKALLSGDRDGRIVQFAEREERAWELPGVVTGLATTADGRYLFTSNMNGTIYVFRLAERLPDAK